MSKVTLDDLNHDPSLIDSLSDKALLKLADEAQDPETSLAGSLRSDLTTRANAIRPSETNDGSDDGGSDAGGAGS